MPMVLGATFVLWGTQRDRACWRRSGRARDMSAGIPLASRARALNARRTMALPTGTETADILINADDGTALPSRLPSGSAKP
eukprot:scaffold10504_cov124-Isochrysis_galbana.AAC.4